jgi:hypothetical protein
MTDLPDVELAPSRAAWTEAALRFAGRLRPGCEAVVVDQRCLTADEAWVCVRAGSQECVLGLRARAGRQIDLLYCYPEPAT